MRLVQLDVDLSVPFATRAAAAAEAIATQAGADLVVLPELWPHGAFVPDRWADEAQELDGPLVTTLAGAARAAGCWVHAGTVVERGEDGTLYNTALVYGPDGSLVATYRKIHPFHGEADTIGAGERVTTVDTPYGRLGLATCYDLRFPELFRRLIDAGAELLVVSASWPRVRLAHWSLLLRARAVENQAWVVATNAAGAHAGTSMAGHSLVIAPDGEVVAEAGDGPQVLAAHLDPGRVAEYRRAFPVLADRRLGLPEPRTHQHQPA